MNSHRRRRLVRLGAVFVLFWAVLPNVMYLGHWGQAGAAERMHSPAEAQEHADHCHAGPSRCGGEPSLVNAWVIGGEEWSLVPDAAPRRVEASEPARAEDPSLPIDTPPPRYV